MIIFMVILGSLIVVFGLLATLCMWNIGKVWADEKQDMIATLVALMYVLCIVLCIIFLIVIPSVIGAGAKAKIINSQYGTEYTAEEIFWASGTIDKILRTENNVQDRNQKIQLDIQ